MKASTPLVAALALTACLAACGPEPVAPVEVQPEPPAIEAPALADVPEIRPGILQGYLAKEELTDSLALLPAPPADGSAAKAHDLDVSQAGLLLRDTPSWELAARDAHLSFPMAATHFSCAMGMPIDEARTPQLYRLLRRTLADLGLASYGAKNNYQRKRPFLSNGQPICSPQDQEELITDGSYPSGHTAVGWGWALILAELNPDHSTAILARGLQYGTSRIVCNVHWNSDVQAGKDLGAAAVARLHTNPEFNAAMRAAATEVKLMRAEGAEPNGDCDLEGRVRGQ